MATVWMVRAGGGKFADDFVENKYVGINIDAQIDLSSVQTREEIDAALRRAGHPESPNGVGQVYRIRKEIATGDTVITYDTARREYPVGEVSGPYQYRPGVRYPHQRPVNWVGRVRRDDLSPDTLNRLGSLLAVFLLNESAGREVLSVLKGERPIAEQAETAGGSVPEGEVLVREEVADKAKELVKDRVVRLSWESMQELVAGVLRAMGYKTRISPSGPDRGKDIVASPDGLGLQDPRIVVEVKHRRDAMGAPDVRSFIAGLRSLDRGLYMSTGGFTKEAYYEAERAQVPVMLLDVDDLVELLIEHYDNVDKETTALVPLKPIYWPVE